MEGSEGGLHPEAGGPQSRLGAVGEGRGPSGGDLSKSLADLASADRELGTSRRRELRGSRSPAGQFAESLADLAGFAGGSGQTEKGAGGMPESPGKTPRLSSRDSRLWSRSGEIAGGPELLELLRRELLRRLGMGLPPGPGAAGAGMSA